jgi:S1-C subfamily serine protease
MESPPLAPDDLEPIHDAPPLDGPFSAPPLDPPPLEPPSAPPTPTPTRPGGRGAVVLVVVALVAGTAGAALTRIVDGPRRSSLSPVTQSIRLDGATLNVAGVVAKAAPSVVSIQADLGGRQGGRAAGTGVILTAAGEVLTNAHVVEGATAVRVTLAGESQARSAEVVGTDPTADLALLRITGASGLRAAELGTSAAVAVGDDVVAIGNALALRGGPTVTRGIVSALDRSLDTDTDTITGLIQTDASISSGNSGGPLVNAKGQVIGINTAVAASGGGTSAENIGFAIAIDQAMPVVERLRNHQPAASAGYLGIQSADPTDGSRGATVMAVETGSPAAGAGLKVGDLITQIGDKSVDGAAALASAVRSHKPGDKVAVHLVRDGKSLVVNATLATRPAN